MNSQPEHKDKLGKIINVDDFVAYPYHNTLGIGRVIKLNNKMVKVVKVPAGKYVDTGTNKYPIDMVKVNSEDITFYLLSQKTK